MMKWPAVQIGDMDDVLLTVGADGKFATASVADAVPEDLKEPPQTIGVPELQ